MIDTQSNTSESVKYNEDYEPFIMKVNTTKGETNNKMFNISTNQYRDDYNYTIKWYDVGSDRSDVINDIGVSKNKDYRINFNEKRRL